MRGLNRSIEDIITQLDDFSNSKECKNLKNCGVTFYSDLIKFDEPVLREKITKLNNRKIKQPNNKKIYLNKHVKSLINLVKTYGMNGTLNYNKFQELAREEDIIDKKFYIHFNQACFLGYLKKLDNQVHFVMDYD